MAFQPMPLFRRPAPFDHPEWIFELKYDGFRSLAVIQNGRTQLISRNGNPFNSFDTLRKAMTAPGRAICAVRAIFHDRSGLTQVPN
jgi:ATP-dependent DNA ligase